MTDDTKPISREGLTDPSDAEMREAFDQAAVFSNKVLVTAGGPNVRIAFMEQRKFGEDQVTRVRAAVVMDIPTMQKLARILNGLEESIVEVPLEAADG